MANIFPGDVDWSDSPSTATPLDSANLKQEETAEKAYVDAGDAAVRAASAQVLVRTSGAPKTANYTAVPTDSVPCDISGGSFTVTLPAAPANNTRIAVKVVKVSGTPGSTSLTLAAGGSDVFNVAAGSTSLTFTARFQGVTLQYDSASSVWTVQATDTPLAVALGAAQTGTDNTVGGPGGTPVSSSLRREIDPLLDYGAVGDGIADDTVAVANAFAAAAASGRALVFRKTYLTGPVSVVSVNGMRLRAVGGGLKLKPGAGDLLSFSTCTGLEIEEGVSLDGNKSGVGVTGGGLVLVQCVSCRVKANVASCARVGMQLYLGSDLTVEGATIVDIGSSPVTDGSKAGIIAQAVAGLRIDTNILKRINDSAILAPGCTDAVIDGNRIDTTNFIGIGLGAAAGNAVVIASNVIRNCPNSNGIDTGTTTGITITGNNIEDSLAGFDADLSSLTVRTAVNITCTGNTVRRCTGGLAIGGPLTVLGHTALISDNTIDTVQQHGIVIDSMRGVAVNGNVIHNCSRVAGGGFAGIHMGATGVSQECVVVGNRISDDTANSYGINRGTGGDYNIYALNHARGCAATLAGVAGANDVAVNNI